MAKTNKSPKAKKTRRSTKTLKTIESKLRTEREELVHQLGELERHGENGPESYEEDREPETATYERERDLTLQENIRDLIDKVDHALSKISDGSYGICESCGKTIEAGRLRALPHAALCIACKRAEERP